ncbi:DUF3265 domain-containing protein [Vibrio parahaemolyticus]|nr:DUF3265 domain-containing protein [Vibrio parahaemolyticus]MBE4151696.1 DUF3265 domain-containing protein [Vibrio parahaemolyticus]
MTKRLRGTWHAWHFRFAVCLVVKVLCSYFCIACLRPLTRRYATGESCAKTNDGR